jgi:hypothetical protein
MDTAATNPLRSARGPLAGAAGPFLFPWLSAATRNFSADLRIVRTKPGIRCLAGICLMHQIHIDRGFKDLRRQFHLTKLFALDI